MFSHLTTPHRTTFPPPTLMWMPLQSFSLTWTGYIKPFSPHISLAGFAAALPPSLTRLCMRLGQLFEHGASVTLNDLSHLTSLQHLDLDMALTVPPLPEGSEGPAAPVFQGVPSSLSRLTWLYLSAEAWETRAPLHGLGESLAGLPHLRHLSITGGLLARWPEQLPGHLTWLDLQCRHSGPPPGYSWRQLAPQLRHLAVRSFSPYPSPYRDEWRIDYQELEPAALPLGLRSLECVHLTLRDELGGLRALRTLSQITTLTLTCCGWQAQAEAEAEAAAGHHGAQPEPADEGQSLGSALATLWQLRELRLRDSYLHPLDWGQLARQALPHLRALTRLHLECCSTSWFFYHRRHLLHLALLPCSLRHLQCAGLKVSASPRVQPQLGAAAPAQPAAPAPLQQPRLQLQQPRLQHLTTLRLLSCTLPEADDHCRLSQLHWAGAALRHLALRGCHQLEAPLALHHLICLTSLDLSYWLPLHTRRGSAPWLDLSHLTQLRQVRVGHCPRSRVARPAAGRLASPLAPLVSHAFTSTVWLDTEPTLIPWDYEGWYDTEPDSEVEDVDDDEQLSAAEAEAVHEAELETDYWANGRYSAAARRWRRDKGDCSSRGSRRGGSSSRADGSSSRANGKGRRRSSGKGSSKGSSGPGGSSRGLGIAGTVWSWAYA